MKEWGTGKVPEMAARVGIQNTSVKSRWTPVKQEATWEGRYRQAGGRRGRKWEDFLPPGSYLILEGRAGIVC